MRRGEARTIRLSRAAATFNLAAAALSLPFALRCRAEQWREAANDAVRVRFHGACYAEWRIERLPRHPSRWGSRAEPFRSERSRRMRGADVARVARRRL